MVRRIVETCPGGRVTAVTDGGRAPSEPASAIGSDGASHSQNHATLFRLIEFPSRFGTYTSLDTEVRSKPHGCERIDEHPRIQLEPDHDDCERGTGQASCQVEC